MTVVFFSETGFILARPKMYFQEEKKVIISKRIKSQCGGIFFENSYARIS